MSFNASEFFGTNIVSVGSFSGSIVGSAHSVSNWIGQILVMANAGPTSAGTLKLTVQTSNGSLPGDTWTAIQSGGTFAVMHYGTESFYRAAIDHADCKRYLRVYGEISGAGVWPASAVAVGHLKAVD